MEADLKNITRFTYETASYMGWRVAFSYRGRLVSQYFSDRAYGSKEASLKAAKAMRDSVRDALEEAERHVEAVFSQIADQIQKEAEGEKQRSKGRWVVPERARGADGEREKSKRL